MLEGFEVIDDAIGRSDAKGGADFPHGGGGPCPGSVNTDETEDRLLFCCQSFHETSPDLWGNQTGSRSGSWSLQEF